MAVRLAGHTTPLFPSTPARLEKLWYMWDLLLVDKWICRKILIYASERWIESEGWQSFLDIHISEYIDTQIGLTSIDWIDLIQKCVTHDNITKLNWIIQTCQVNWRKDCLMTQGLQKRIINTIVEKDWVEAYILLNDRFYYMVEYDMSRESYMKIHVKPGSRIHEALSKTPSYHDCLADIKPKIPSIFSRGDLFMLVDYDAIYDDVE